MAGARRPGRWGGGAGREENSGIRDDCSARREETGEMRGAADCAWGEQMLQVNGALVTGRNSKSPNTCYGH